MKKIAYSILVGAVAASSALAGERTVSHKDSKDKVVVPEAIPCFKDQEFQLDVFGSFTNGARDYRYDDGFGGGIGVNYFFTRNIGVGVDGNLYDGGVHGVWTSSASVIARFPVDLGHFCFAPYIFGGGGVRSDGHTVGTEHAGAGIEFRVTPRVGIFSDGRYTWAEDRNDSITTRVGVRFVF